MGLSNGIEILTAKDLDRFVPTTRDIHLTPDHSSEKTRLLSLQSPADVFSEIGIGPVDNYALILSFNEAVNACPGLGIDMFRPALETTSIVTLGFFLNTSYALGKAMRHDDGFGGFDVFPYSPQSFERLSIFPRDLIMISKSSHNTRQSELILSEPLANDDMTRYTFAIAASRKAVYRLKNCQFILKAVM